MLPQIGPTRSIVTAEDFARVASGTGRGPGPAAHDDPWTSDQVETIAALLTAAARATIPNIRFRPAHASNRAVRMVVELPFDFVLH